MAPTRPPRKRTESPLEALLAAQLKAAGVGGWKREETLVAGRRFRADFTWKKSHLTVEVQGGTHMRRGGHTTGRGYESDCHKLCLTTLAGWRSLWVTGRMVRDGTALAYIQQALEK